MKNKLEIEIGVNLAISEETANACLGIVQIYCNNTNRHVDEKIAIDTNEVLLSFKKRYEENKKDTQQSNQPNN